MFEGKTGTVTISKSSTGKFYASILVDDGIPLPDKFVIDSDTTVGIDVGIKDFAVLSNGQVFGNPKYLESSQKRLGCLQRRVSRKRRGVIGVRRQSIILPFVMNGFETVDRISYIRLVRR